MISNSFIMLIKVKFLKNCFFLFYWFLHIFNESECLEFCLIHFNYTLLSSILLLPALCQHTHPSERFGSMDPTFCVIALSMTCLSPSVTPVRNSPCWSPQPQHSRFHPLPILTQLCLEVQHPTEVQVPKIEPGSPGDDSMVLTPR